MIASSAFLGFFLDIHSVAYKHAPARAWIAFAVIVVFGCTMSLANIGTSVAIERDWVTTISLEHSQETLTRLNTYMRRIDLLCKLLAPLFVSLLTTTVSYPFAVAFGMGFAAATLAFELVWVQVVYNRFPVLARQDQPGPVASNGDVEGIAPHEDAEQAAGHDAPQQNQGKKSLSARWLTIVKDWKEFSRMPVFSASVAISLLYLTVLS